MKSLFTLALSFNSFADKVRPAGAVEKKLFCDTINKHLELVEWDGGIDYDKCLKARRSVQVQQTGKNIISGKIDVISHSGWVNHSDCSIAYANKPILKNVMGLKNDNLCKVN